MAGRTPFVLLDDARSTGAADAHFYENPREVFIARLPGEVAAVLAAADTAQQAQGGTLAGYIAYEAGLALEPRLAPLADARTGGAGPLVWLGLFGEEQVIPAAKVADWLTALAPGEASIGPLEPQLSFGAYCEAFAQMQEAIRAGDIYQVNLTFSLTGSYRGDELALYRALRRAAQAGYGGGGFGGGDRRVRPPPRTVVAPPGPRGEGEAMKGGPAALASSPPPPTFPPPATAAP